MNHGGGKGESQAWQARKLRFERTKAFGGGERRFGCDSAGEGFQGSTLSMKEKKGEKGGLKVDCTNWKREENLIFGAAKGKRIIRFQEKAGVSEASGLEEGKGGGKGGAWLDYNLEKKFPRHIRRKSKSGGRQV